jgi:hypothetical protein
MLIVINLSRKIEELKKDIANYDEVERVINIGECTDYRIVSNSELLIFNGRTILYSCCYGQYKSKRFITHIYNRKSELVYQYNIG